MTNPNVFRIIIVGESGVGKTAIIDRFIWSTFPDYDDVTICEDYRKQILLFDRVAYLEINEPLGTAGDRWPHWRLQIRDADAVLLVYSITSLRTFEQITVLRDEALAGLTDPLDQDGACSGGALGSRGGRSVPFYLVGNKSDRNIEREVSVDEGVQLAKKLGCSFFETTAKEGHNVDEAIYGLLRSIERDPTDEQEPTAIGGFRGRLDRLARSLRLRKSKP